MSSTNKTAELHLSQFIGTDIPSILTDYNGDMRKIDAGVLEVKQATAGAVSDLSSVTARVTNAEQSISGLNSTVQGIATRVVTAEGEIDGIQSLIPADATENNKLLTKNSLKHGDRILSYSSSRFSTVEEAIYQIESDITSNGFTKRNVYLHSDGVGELLYSNGTWKQHNVTGEAIGSLTIQDVLIHRGAGSDTGAVWRIRNNISSNTSTYTVTDITSNFLGDIIEVYVI